MKGSCTLVGAGPGDPELLTVKALRAIQRATVLLVDDLVSDELLAFALDGVEPRPRIVHVGKRGGCASTPQAVIDELMVAEAQRGEQVVRLKGGDPFIFGRGGEELQALRAHGIDAAVVNGITSALAAANALGTALTHRDHAQGVMFVTGHPRQGGERPDWAALAQAVAAGITLVVYMGVAQAPTIRAGLLRKLPPSTPVAVVRHASLSTQRAAIGTLGGLEALIETHRLASPSIIIVGDVLRAARVAAGEAATDVGTDGSSLDAADGATDGGTVSGTDSATDATMDRAVGAVARQGNGASARSSRLAHRGGGASPDGENPLAQPSSRALY